MTDHREPILRLRNVSRTYTGASEVHALQNVNIEISAGDHVAIVGRSGAGKSTLLNILGLLEQPTSGEYWVRGLNTSECSARQITSMRANTFGFVFQSFHLLKTHSVRENVAVGLMYNDHRASVRRDTINAIVERVGLSHRINAFPSTLSGGEQQRVAIARALAGRPQVLLCDEPTGNLDSATASQVLGLLDELNATGITLLVVTHDRDVANRAQRQIVMADGTVMIEAA